MSATAASSSSSSSSNPNLNPNTNLSTTLATKDPKDAKDTPTKDAKDTPTKDAKDTATKDTKDERDRDRSQVDSSSALDTTKVDRDFISAVLNSPTALGSGVDKLPLSYVNKGQTYFLQISDTTTKEPTQDHDSLLILTFHESSHDSSLLWQLWLGPDCAKFPFEIVETASLGIRGVERYFNAIRFRWNGTIGASVVLKFNCLSTDFLQAKGVSGVDLRFELVTFDEEVLMDRSCVRLKIFQEKGAQRKLREEQKLDKTSNRDGASVAKPSTRFSAVNYDTDAMSPTLYINKYTFITFPNNNHNDFSHPVQPPMMKPEILQFDWDQSSEKIAPPGSVYAFRGARAPPASTPFMAPPTTLTNEMLLTLDGTAAAYPTYGNKHTATTTFPSSISNSGAIPGSISGSAPPGLVIVSSHGPGQGSHGPSQGSSHIHSQGSGHSHSHGPSQSSSHGPSQSHSYSQSHSHSHSHSSHGPSHSSSIPPTAATTLPELESNLGSPSSTAAFQYNPRSYSRPGGYSTKRPAEMLPKNTSDDLDVASGFGFSHDTISALEHFSLGGDAEHETSISDLSSALLRSSVNQDTIDLSLPYEDYRYTPQEKRSKAGSPQTGVRKFDVTDLSSLEIDENRFKKKRAVRCLLVRLETDPTYDAIFLDHLTADDLKAKLAARFDFEVPRINSFCRMSRKGLLVKIDDEMVAYFEEEQDFVLTLRVTEPNGVDVVLC